MEHDPPDCSLSSNEEVSRRLEWSQLLEVVMEIHEVANGVVLDLAADRYGDVIDLVDRELECCGSWLELSVERREKLILLTATSDEADGLTAIRSMVGLDS